MGLDLSRPTQTYSEVYLPSETLKSCTPDHCWCGGGHRNKRYLYHERGGDGNDRYHDLFDYMDKFVTGGGWPMPWRDSKEWTVRDFDRFGEIFGEYCNRERGRRGGGGGMSPFGGGGFGGFGGGMGGLGGMPFMAGMMPMMMTPDDFGGGGGRSSGRRHRYARLSDFERMQEQMDDRFRRMAEEYQKNMTERDAFLFGSDAERKQEQYKQRMLKTMQEMMPQLQQLFTMGQAAGAMGGGGAGAGMNPMMAAQAQANMMGGMSGMSGGMGQGGLGGMGMGSFGGMNPMTAAAMGQHPMAAQMSPMMQAADPRAAMGMAGGGGGGGLGGRRGWGGGARRRGRRLMDYDEDDDDDDWGGGGGRLGRRGGGRRTRGGGGWGDLDDDDFLGGLDRGDPRLPRGGPRGPPRRPGRDGGGGGGPFYGGGGGAGAAFDRDFFPDRPRPRTDAADDILGAGVGGRLRTPSSDPVRPMPTMGPDRPPSPLARPDFPMPAGMSPRVAPAGTGIMGDGLGSGMPMPMPMPAERPMPGAAGFATGPGMPSFRGRRFEYLDLGGAPPYGGGTPLGGGGVGGGIGGAGIRPGMRRAGTGFGGPPGGPEAPLARPREDEELRGEGEAGAPPGARDIK